MSDERSRELERRWREAGSVEDQTEFLLGLVRVGQLPKEKLDLAAYWGHEAARRAVAIEAPLIADEGFDLWLNALAQVSDAPDSSPSYLVRESAQVYRRAAVKLIEELGSTLRLPRIVEVWRLAEGCVGSGSVSPRLSAALKACSAPFSGEKSPESLAEWCAWYLRNVFEDEEFQHEHVATMGHLALSALRRELGDEAEAERRLRRRVLKGLLEWCLQPTRSTSQ